MGTRHLTIVMLDNKHSVAQYGQWDGYPEGQGKTILNFLKNWNKGAFVEKLRQASFTTEDDINNINQIIRAEKLFDKWPERWPALTRDTGAKILSLIQDSEPGIKLKDDLDFAADSLFCEWAYVLDLDNDKLEVYKGFNKTPLDKTDRFYYLQEVTSESEYYPVRLVASYDFSELPTVEQMVSDCDCDCDE